MSRIVIPSSWESCFSKKVWQSCYLLLCHFQVPWDTKMKRHGAIINLDLWQLDHFVWWNYTTMNIDAPKRNPAFVVTKWHENGSTLDENGGRWRWNRPLFFRTMRMFQRDAVWLMGWCDGFHALMIVIHSFASLPCFFFLQNMYMDHHNQDLSGAAVQTHASQSISKFY